MYTLWSRDESLNNRHGSVFTAAVAQDYKENTATPAQDDKENTATVAQDDKESTHTAPQDDCNSTNYLKICLLTCV